METMDPNDPDYRAAMERKSFVSKRTLFPVFADFANPQYEFTPNCGDKSAADLQLFKSSKSFGALGKFCGGIWATP
eukprot:2656083-Rhodomonas_salina.1